MSESEIKWFGPERRIQPPISREEHSQICSASERKLNERFSAIHERFADGTVRMNRIESSINDIKAANEGHNKRFDDIAKLQYELATHVERIDKALVESSEMTDGRMDRLDASLQQNTAVTQEIKDVLDTAKGAFRMFGWLGDGLKWALGIGGAVLAFWVALKDFRGH